MKPAHEILKTHFHRKQLNKPNYSLRSLARDLKLSPGYVSEILSGKKPIPKGHLKNLIKALEMDQASVTALSASFLPEPLREITFASLQQHSLDFVDLDRNFHSILEHWSLVALWDLATCSDFQTDPEWIGHRLGITRYEAQRAFSYLKARGYLRKNQDGRFEKIHNRARLPTVKSHAAVRAFHRQMLAKAMEVLAHDTSPSDFAKRNVSGVTIAANPKNLAAAQQVLNEAIQRITNILTKGDCTEVYQLNLQLFPLTKG